MPSIDDERRAVLAGTAATLAGLAGCAGTPTPTGSATDSPTDTPTTTRTPTGTPTGTFSLEPVPSREVDGPLTVYPEDLRTWLRTAATTDQTLRTHAETPTYDPSPPLTAFERITFEDGGAAPSGVYDLSVEGGTRHELLVGAEAASPPDGADVTPVSSLPEPRREVALAAIRGRTGETARVYPETELGSWVRNDFFAGYFEHEGTVYRGKEAQQTDAEFFATAVWYVLSATAVDAASAPTTLRLTPIEDAIRGIVNELRAGMDRPSAAQSSVTGETGATARAFAEANPLLLTHDAVFRVGFES